jgi:hypothetical protein
MTEQYQYLAIALISLLSAFLAGQWLPALVLIYLALYALSRVAYYGIDRLFSKHWIPWR